MAADYNFFYEDEVYRMSKKGHIEFGMVLENAELVSGDENSDTEDGERMRKGHIRVAWHPRGEEEVIPEKKVKLSDRSLMPGDVVRRMIKGKDTQRGYCRNVTVTSSVQIVGTKQVIYNVNSQDLTPLEEFSSDIAVCMDSWVGIVKMVQSKVHVKAQDGSVCVMDEDDATDLDDLRERRERDSEFHRYDFYPGQYLWGPMHCFENAEWLHTTKEMANMKRKPHKTLRVTVEDVKVVALGVNWQCWAYSKDGTNAEKEQPKYLIQGKSIKKVKLLNVFEPCTLQVGDRNYYTFEDGNLLLTRDEWRALEKEVRLGKEENGPLKPKSSPKKGKDRVECAEAKATVEVELNNKRDSDSSDQYEDIETDGGSQSDTASISSSCSTGSQGLGLRTDRSRRMPNLFSSGKKAKRGPTLVTRWLRRKCLKRAKKRIPLEVVEVKPGDRLVVETLTTTSKADVVWQDGTVETGIPSIELYPIHHLDDQEFFPGDFVIENKEDASTRVYGVIQRVDHAGRTAIVKWFRTYTSADDPLPAHLEENEVSVYDLKDHPDFQYRPGTVVIRVANFEGENSASTAGQVLDNYPSGQVRVWWVNGHHSMCWPQDLYKVGEYDSDDGELWDDGSSEGSWETESEHSVIDEASPKWGGEADGNGSSHRLDLSSLNWLPMVCMPDDQVEKMLKPRLAANIEKARIAMARLEEIFTQNPSLQTSNVMRQLLEVYKDCRCLDKLMGTYFFHESNFQGLLARVREKGRASTAQRVAEQVSRLFQTEPPNYKAEENGDSGINSNKGSTEDSLSSSDLLTENIANLESQIASEVGAKPTEITKKHKGGSNEEHPPRPHRSGSECHPAEEISSTQVCAKLCSLIKAQLVKAHTEVLQRFGRPAVFLGADAEDASENGVEVAPPVVPAVLAPASDEEVEKEGAAEGKEVIEAITQEELEGFEVNEIAPDNHKYKLGMFQAVDPKAFFRSVKKEMRLLKTGLPPGIWVKGYEDRMDLFSVMILGPEKTPYEGGVFLFDFQLSGDYPKSPPMCHYLSYCSDRLNPNLYEDGKVCVSLLGTWSGKGTEVWTSNSNLLQVIVSLQGLILVSEPYFNEAGYEKQKGSQQGRENSRMYNEMVVLKLVQATTKMLQQIPEVFKKEIINHFRANAYRLIGRLEKWLEISERYNMMHPLSPTTPTTFREFHGEVVSKTANIELPEFPLIPASKGFCISLKKSLETFKDILASCGIKESSSS